MTNKPFAQDVVIRRLNANDCSVIADTFSIQGWFKPVEQFQKYLSEVEEGRRDVFIAEAAGEFAGYVTIVWNSDYLPFAEAGIPEIVDFNVLVKFHRQGIGSRLMDAAEQKIVERSATAGIGVGLTPDYGAAQVLYVKRGYVPDGRGVVSHGKFIQSGEMIPVDDDLALYFTRKL